MAKKKGAKKSKSKSKSKKGQDELKEVGHKIWLAGLGALSIAETEGTKLLKTAGEQGSKFFKGLVEKGEAVEAQSKPAVDKLKAKATKARKEAVKTAEDGWEKVENVVDARVTATLHKLGIPSKSEIEQLTKRVELLTKKLDAAQQKKAAKQSSRKKSTRKKTTRKSASKKTKKTAKAASK